MKLVQQGAEAKLYRDGDRLIKKRIKKGYRITDIDKKIRKRNTKREFNLIEKAKKVIPVPRLIKSTIDELEMEFIDGKKLRDVLEKRKDKYRLAKQIGKQAGLLHEQNIIHGDLTTSNMIIRAVPLLTHKEEIVFIDFGLGFISDKVEDKAVDLHLLKQAFESTHYKIHEKLFKAFLQGYKEYKGSKNVVERLEIVEKRGRYKRRGGL